LVNQIEMAAVKKSFFLNHAQLSLLTEQIQKVSSHLNSRLKESSAASTTSHVTTATATTSNLTTSTHANNAKSKSSSASAFERNLAQKLALSDDFQASPLPDSHSFRFLNYSCSCASIDDLRFLTMRNRVLEAECVRLERDEGFRIHRQADAFGQTSLLVSHPQTGSAVVSFLLPLLYPQTELLYRIEGDADSVHSDGLLPAKLEPRHAPFTISTILRRYLSIKRT
jgi:hypothetical protein